MDINIFTLIPARSGSKSILDKNLQLLAGISLLERAINFSKKLSFSQLSLVSTDSLKYSQIASKAGALILGLRPDYLSEDSTSSDIVLKYEWEKLELHLKKKFDFCILLEPTSPFRKLEDISALYEMIIKKSIYESGFTASRLPQSLSPSKVFNLSDSGFVTQYGKDYPSLPISNKIDCSKENLIKNGVAYIVSRKQIYNKGTIITPYSYVSINEGLRINIDTIDDLYLSQHYESLLD